MGKRTRKTEHVIIIGAGIAGLTAALTLRDQGHRVRVLEARRRAGGRICTLRSPFAEGLHVEAGARYIRSGHRLIRALAERFNVNLVRADATGGRAVLYIRDTRLEVGADTRVAWPSSLALTAAEQNLSPKNFWFDCVKKSLPSENGSDRRWVAEFEKPDDISFGHLLRDCGLSPGAREIVRLSLFEALGEGIDSISALSALMLAAEGGESFTARGGMDLLPRRLAADLPSQVVFGAFASHVTQTARGVSVRFRRAGRSHKWSADHVIFTLPLPAMTRIAITPPLSWAKRDAFHHLAYTSVLRIFLQFRQRFWERESLSGHAFTDLPIQRCLHATTEQPGTRGILETFSTGYAARRLGAMSQGERVRSAVHELEKCFPNAPRFFEHGVSKYWDDDKWSGGGYCWFRPGQFASYRATIASQEGRLHFAGDHTSLRPAWMEGAAESAIRAVEEISAN
jgi:monoamine oxidase